MVNSQADRLGLNVSQTQVCVQLVMIPFYLKGNPGMWGER
jgi:hypothetical protein